MNRAQRHRGPDSSGEYSVDEITLAACRLGIIDSANGSQPLYNEDKSLVLVANAEIYNFLELRPQLEAKGHRFRTLNDAETILHLYEEHGADCVHHLRGMFSFALWDLRRELLLIARDRMGEKPLYLFENHKSLVFASELKALLHSGLVPFELDPQAIDNFFHYQFIPEPATAIRGVRKLRAGYLLIIRPDPWTITEKCYWRMEDAAPVEGDPAQILRAELETIAKIATRSDVAIGVALSGGIDSSAVAALAVPHASSLQAFSVGYPGYPVNDERSEARLLADNLRMPFHEIELTTTEMAVSFPELVFRRDDPIADISGFGYQQIMARAQELGVRVMLQGHGGDELFWGYDWHQRATQESMLRSELSSRSWLSLPNYFRFERAASSNPLKAKIKSIYSGWRRFQSHRHSAANRMIFYDVLPDFDMAQTNTPAMYSKRFSEELGESCPTALFEFDPTSGMPLEITATRLICETYLRENGITQSDRLGMASSVEVRLPLLDYKLVEAVVGLRKAHSDLNLPPKAWLKDAVRHILPESILNRPKRGFNPPVMDWHNALFARYGESLNDGYLVQQRVLTPEIAKRFSRGDFPDDAIVPLSFKALVLEQWCQKMSAICSIEHLQATAVH